MQSWKWLLAVGSMSLLVVSASAQEAFEAPKPTPEHEVLGMWAGNWVGKGEMKPGPFGPGGAMTWTEECSWLGGQHFFMVCTSEGTGPTGAAVGIGIMGYDSQKKVYTHFGADSTGWSDRAEGMLDGDSWTFHSRQEIEGKTYHTRFVMKMDSPGKLSFTWGMSEDGKTWQTMMDGTSEKK